MERILVGYDGSAPATRALERAAGLARSLNAPLTVLTAAADRLGGEERPLSPAEDERLGRELADRGAARARELGAPRVDSLVSLEAPDDALVLAAEEGYTLVVVGHRGIGAVRELFLGSTAKSVLDRLQGSVLVVR